MAHEPAAIVTDADVRSLAAKLTGLHALLTPAEQLLLLELLRRSAERDEAGSDTTGFAWGVSFNPFPCLDAIAGDRSRQEKGRGPQGGDGAEKDERHRPPAHQPTSQRCARPTSVRAPFRRRDQ